MTAPLWLKLIGCLAILGMGVVTAFMVYVIAILYCCNGGDA